MRRLAVSGAAFPRMLMILASIAARIPTVTVAERCADEIVLAEREHKLWHGVSDLLAASADRVAELVCAVDGGSLVARVCAEEAFKRACAAHERLERLRRGEDVAPGEGVDDAIAAAVLATAAAKATRHLIVVGGEASA